MSIVKSKFGTTKDGKEVTKFTMKNGKGMEVSLIDFGAAIVNLLVPDRDGVFDDVVLGYDTVSGYEVNGPNFGVPVGRFANRIANAKFSLNGKEYKVDANEGTNCLHGGFMRYNHRMYHTECQEAGGSDTIIFSRLSPDSEQGMPGNFEYSVTYTLTEDNELEVCYNAVSDADTLINMTQHAYFNLGKGGHKCKDIYSQEIQIEADYYTPVDDILIPTGEIKEVAGTALDFRKFKPVKQGLGAKTPDEVTVPEYDHNFVLRDKNDGEVSLAATFRAPDNGRMMEVFTDQPGIQLYTAGTVNEPGGKDGMTYGNFSGSCFETQNFPNAINTPDFPNCILKAGVEYESLTVFRFSTF